jgi:hypothetical protein
MIQIGNKNNSYQRILDNFIEQKMKDRMQQVVISKEDIWRHDIQHSDTQPKWLNFANQENVMLSITSLLPCCVIFCYAKYHYAECHYAECHYAECHYAE